MKRRATPVSEQSQGARTAFLLGAGASREADVPIMKEFVDQFESRLRSMGSRGKHLLTCLQHVKRSARSVGRDPTFDLETCYDVLFAVNRGDWGPSELKRSRATELLEFRLMQFIQSKCLGIGAPRIAYLRPLMAFVSQSSGLDIASLNYDVCVETLCTAVGADCTTGFRGPGGKWSPGSLLNARPSPAVRLMKLHGSAQWFIGDDGHPYEMRATSPHELGLSRGRARTMVLENTLVYPGVGKQPTWGPFPELFACFQRVLAQSSVCVAVGYRFADQHVREVVAQGLRQSADLVLVVLDPNPTDGARRILNASEYRIDPQRVIPVAAGFGFALDRNRLLQFCSGLQDGGRLGPLERRIVPTWRNRQSFIGGAGRLPCRSPGGGSLGYWSLGPSADANSILASTRGVVGSVEEIHLGTGHRTVAVSGVSRVRGVCQIGEDIFLLENAYRDAPTEAKWLESVEGAGRIWRMRTGAGDLCPVTVAGVAAGGAWDDIRARLRQGGVAPWLGLTGVIRWGQALAPSGNGRTVFVSESSAIAEVDLSTGRLRRFQAPADVVNILDFVSLADRLVVLESGIWDPVLGSGRLWNFDLATRRFTMAHGMLPSLAAGVSTGKSGRSVLVSFCRPAPYGEVQEFGLHSYRLLRRWHGLARPRSLICKRGAASHVLVAVEDGLVVLEESGKWRYLT